MPDADAVYIPEVERTYADWLKQHPRDYVINAPKSGTQPMIWHLVHLPIDLQRRRALHRCDATKGYEP